VEGDWPACQGIDSYVKGKSQDALSTMRGFSRWPTWMWANTEILELMDELRKLNESVADPAGFHGLDVYSLFESLDEVLKMLKSYDGDLRDKVEELYSCFEPYRHDERAYARSLVKFPQGCRKEVTQALKEILAARLQDGEKVFDLEQNARIIREAEQYYAAMVSLEDDSWNVRDQHMMTTLEDLLSHYGEGSKAIVWAHNTHIGDYRATDMLVRGEVNLGGLARQRFGEENVALIGFSTYEGEVIASHAWDGPTQKLKIPPGKPESLEEILHGLVPQIGASHYFVNLKNADSHSSLRKVIGHRAIGVIYYPELEQRGNYVPTIPAGRYDGLIFCDRTKALEPLNVKFAKEKIPESYPFGTRI